jgi:TolB-like protein/tetratricopeptide (TPR) repeat protein
MDDRTVSSGPRSDGDIAELAETVVGSAPDAAPIVKRWAHLELRAVLGHGAFGIVYRAWEPRLARDVALKLISDNATRMGFAAAVVEEARLLARVRHPNVVIVHGADQSDGAVGIWMELIEGRTLTRILEQRGPFGADEAAIFGIDVCRAVAAVHKADLIHRDIKADNIMRENGGRVVLMDFGAGTLRSQECDFATSSGTPLYWAPEILRGSRATVGTDIYSIGVLLYHLVTNRYPLHGRTLDELRWAHEKGLRTRLQDERPDLPAAFVRAVERALDPDPAERFKTAGELQSALAAAQEWTIAEAGLPTGTTGAAPAWWQRLRSRYIVAALSLSAIIVTASLAWVGGGFTGVGRPMPTASALTSINSVAVLPFEETSGDPNVTYLANAVPLELTANLAQIGDFKTVPWTFSKAVAARSRSLHEVVAASGADGVVEGSVQMIPPLEGQTARRVRITVQLYQGRTGSVLWSGAFEDEMGHFMGINTRIAEQIAGQIRVKLAVRREARVTSARSIDPDAMDLYLRGRDMYLDRATQQQLKQALDYFTLAISKEPGFPEAYGGVADCYTALCTYWHVLTPAQAYPKILDATSKALALDASLARVWSTRAFARYLLGWDWAGADADFEHALKLPPDELALLHDRHAEYLTAMGRHAEAIAETDAMLSASPQLPALHRGAAWSNFFARRYDAAIEHLQVALRLDPKFVPARTLLGRAYLQKGLYAQGVAELESVATLPDGPAFKHMLAYAYAAAGQSERARRTLSEYVSADGHEYVKYDVALVHVALGEVERALEVLEEGYRAKDTAMVRLNVDPRWDPIRAQPGFQALTRRMQFPE